jgi:hypothetical protein
MILAHKISAKVQRVLLNALVSSSEKPNGLKSPKLRASALLRSEKQTSPDVERLLYN